MRMRSSTDFGRTRLIWQNLVKALEFVYRVFHRDVPTVTRLVPLQTTYYNYLIDLSSC